jgi:hypothetical protein
MMPPFPICPESFGPLNVTRLTGFVSAAQKNDKFGAGPAEVNSVPGSEMNPQLHHAVSDGRIISQIASLNLLHPKKNPRLCALIAQLNHPLIKWTPSIFLLIQDQFHRRLSVA